MPDGGDPAPAPAPSGASGASEAAIHTVHVVVDETMDGDTFVALATSFLETSDRSTSSLGFRTHRLWADHVRESIDISQTAVVARRMTREQAEAVQLCLMGFVASCDIEADEEEEAVPYDSAEEHDEPEPKSFTMLAAVRVIALEEEGAGDDPYGADPYGAGGSGDGSTAGELTLGTATVVEAHDGGLRYSVLYEDGTFEAQVAARRIFPVDVAPGHSMDLYMHMHEEEPEGETDVESDGEGGVLSHTQQRQRARLLETNRRIGASSWPIDFA